MSICDANLSFAMKAEMKIHPMRIMWFTMFVTVAVSAYGMKVFEEPYSEHELSNGIEYWWNSLWCSFITMTTVGYGDYYPVSDEGRWIACIVCSLGFFYVAILCLAFQHELEMTNAEQRSYIILERLKCK